MQVDVVLLVLEALEGNWVLKEFVGFEEVKDPVELADHEFLGLLGLEDPLHLKLFFYFNCNFCHLLIIWYMFSSLFFPYPFMIIKIFLTFCFNSNCLKMYISESPVLILRSQISPHVM